LEVTWGPIKLETTTTERRIKRIGPTTIPRNQQRKTHVRGVIKSRVTQRDAGFLGRTEPIRGETAKLRKGGGGEKKKNPERTDQRTGEKTCKLIKVL